MAFRHAGFLLTMFVFSLTLISAQDSKNDMPPWERLGLSVTEWKMILDNHIPIEKVESLLKDGIGIGEFLQKPWVALRLTEDQWIEKRRAGMTDYDIELETNTTRDGWKKDMKAGLKSDMGGVSENRALLISLTVPGYHPLRDKRWAVGGIMAGTAVGAVSWCVAGSVNKKMFEYIPVAFVLIPDMVWSVIDFRIHKRRFQEEKYQ